MAGDAPYLRDEFSTYHLTVVNRSRKSPLIFGAKTDREMREWMMAIKLLAEKLSTSCSAEHTTTPTTPLTAPTSAGLIYRSTLYTMSKLGFLFKNLKQEPQLSLG